MGLRGRARLVAVAWLPVAAWSLSSPAAAPASWSSLGLSVPVVEALAQCGDFERPTAVQAACIPVAVGGEDCLIHAQTGSGKTLAYLAPLLARVDADRQTTQAVVLVPTRELGLRVARVARRLASLLPKGRDGKQVLVMSLLDGSSHRRQRAWAWAEPPQVIVGNAVSVRDMASHGGLKLVDAVEYVVVDEVDAFLDVKRADDRAALHALLVEDLAFSGPAVSRDGANAAKRLARQTVFATASLTQPRHLATRLAQMRWSRTEPTYVAVAPTLPATLGHFVAAVEKPAQRLAALRLALRAARDRARPGADAPLAAIVFFDAGRPLEAVAAKLAKSDGVSCAVLDERDDLGTRKAQIDAYTAGAVDVLLCTDLGARGIDAPRTTLVVNFDFPPDATTYLHRAGRAARLGRRGAVLTVLLANQRFALARFANNLRVDLDDVPLAAAPLAAALVVPAFDDAD